MKVEKAYKIDDKIIEYDMILKLSYKDFERPQTMGRFLGLVEYSLTTTYKIIKLNLDCSKQYKSCIIEVDLDSISKIEIIE